MCKNRWKTNVLPAICLVIILLFGGMNVCAASSYGFEIDYLSNEEKQTIWKNINIQKISNIKNLNEFSVPIESFDISEQGSILLKLKGNIIVVSNEQGQVLSCLEFENEGTAYVKWAGDHILLLMVRGAIIVELTQNGQMIDVVHADESSINNNSQWNQLYKTTSIRIGNVSYTVQNQKAFPSICSPGFSKLLKIEQNGNIIVLYDISKEQSIKTAGIFALVVLFVIIVVGVVIHNVIKLNKGMPR